jgi:hypothetical protein
LLLGFSKGIDSGAEEGGHMQFPRGSGDELLEAVRTQKSAFHEAEVRKGLLWLVWTRAFLGIFLTVAEVGVFQGGDSGSMGSNEREIKQTFFFFCGTGD